MRFEPVEKIDKLGRRVLLRSPQLSDASALIDYLKTTSGETPFLLREPDEISMTPELEGQFLQGRLDAERECMALAEVEGRIAGSCSVFHSAPNRRAAHRCEIGIALYREYWGCGIGRMLMEHILTLAKEYGYEQAELEVASENTAAIALYESFGFQVFGRLPRNMKYADGTYADMLWMMKML